MTAAFTFYPDIHTQPDNFPLIDPTWMWFFHFDNIFKCKFFFIHNHEPPSSYDSLPLYVDVIPLKSRAALISFLIILLIST